jgi:hypothetical protein
LFAGGTSATADFQKKQNQFVRTCAVGGSTHARSAFANDSLSSAYLGPSIDGAIRGSSATSSVDIIIAPLVFASSS